MSIFGLLGFAFGLIAYTRVDKLEAQLKASGVLAKDFLSEDKL